MHRSLFNRFVEIAEPLIRAYVIGDPTDAKTTLGPIAQPNHVAELEGLVRDAEARGARVVAGGKRASVGGRGRFFEATLIDGVTPEMAVMQRGVVRPPSCPWRAWTRTTRRCDS